METEWFMDRVQLYRLKQDHPDWSIARLATELSRSETWVKKWLRRFREQGQVTWQTFRGLSRAPKNHGRKLHGDVVRKILELRESLKDIYHRTIGPKLILYHLGKDEELKKQGHYIPKSSHTVWRVLKEGGRIPKHVRVYQPLIRPAPMEEWEFDFGDASSLVEGGLEFFLCVDRGTSIFVDTQVAHHYRADTALLAAAQLFLINGLPRSLRFDRDPRLVASWTTKGYPSAFIRFLYCLGVDPVVCPPRRPDLKPFVERGIRTAKHESLYIHRPDKLPKAAHVLDDFRLFYNIDRPHQGLSCGNVPPYTAFPSLPSLPSLPDQVDPDAWLQVFHGRVFKRKVTTNGTVMVDKDRYYIGKAYGGKRIALHLHAGEKNFHVQHEGKRIKKLPIKGLHHQVMPFQAYLALMIEEAKSIEQHLLAKKRRASN